MTKVGKRLSAAGIALFFAGSVSQVLGAEVRPDPLLSIDQNRPAVIERIVEVFRPAFGPGQEATVREALAGLRADRLLAASLAPSLDGLLAVMKSSESVSTLALAKPVGKALGDAATDLVYTPVTPCRLFDTRVSQGGLGTPTPGVRRTYGAITPVANQGGPGGCAAGSGAAVALIQIGTLTPSGNGLLQGGPQGAASFPNALILYQPGDQYGTAVAMPLNPANGQFDLVEQFATADLYGDLLGYFRAPTGGFVTGNCPAGKAVRSVNPDGSVVCESTAGTNAIYQPAMRPWVLNLAPLGSNFCCYGGGFTDGTSGYLVPFGLNNIPDNSGTILKFNIDAFTTATTASLDLTTIDPNLKGFIGGFTDGRYGYLVPYVSGGNTKHGRLVRFDLQNFTTGGVTVLNLASIDAALAGFWGGFTDGRHGYLYSYYNNAGPSGRMVRVDLQNYAPGGVTVLNLASIDSDLVGHTGGFTDGRYGYVFGAGYPTANGKVARVDLANFTTGGVTVLDLTTIEPALKGFVGGFQDGRYGYLVPYNNGAFHGNLVRIDLGNFTGSGVTVLDLSTVDAALVGFNGGFTDGRYAWLSPYAGTKAARVDLANFTSSGVRAVDFATIDPALTGFAGGFANGKYGVMVPWFKLAVSGFYQKVVRIQLQEGAGTQ